MSIITVPVTTSPRASRVTAPCRTIGAKTTSPNSPTVIGVPSPRVATRIRRTSSSDSIRPSPRINRCSPARVR